MLGSVSMFSELDLWPCSPDWALGLWVSGSALQDRSALQLRPCALSLLEDPAPEVGACGQSLPQLTVRPRAASRRGAISSGGSRQLQHRTWLKSSCRDAPGTAHWRRGAARGAVNEYAGGLNKEITAYLHKVAGLSVIFWQHWKSTAQQCLAKAGELEKQLSASRQQLKKLERRVAEETVRADDMQRRLSNEGAQLVDVEGRLDRARTSLSACTAEKIKLKQQKKQEINPIDNVKELKIQALEKTTHQLKTLVQNLCVHVVAGSLVEARKLCPTEAIVEAGVSMQGH
ncbi:hypothetical protein NDU88_001172 [Pleurodeles waltl]|uniref:Uncharacterized protein n=1 Tax=Pleurodeles waltl TaxID=8319 RepID=A0AAV7KPP2_PLEWA|nr:hypothetical protein NDU88_001172 [Pleurodeles waltl]